MGPRIVDVSARLEQVSRLTAVQVEALDILWDGGLHDDPARREAWMEAMVAARGPLGDLARQATQAVTTSAAWHRARTLEHNAATDAVASEMVKSWLAPEHYLVLSAPLELVLHLPTWWCDLPARRLFFEMLTQGVSVADAAACVTALI